MKLKRLWIVIVLIAAAACAALAFQNSAQYEVLFEKARFTMETKGDLRGAIELFDEIIKKYPNARDYAAKSLYLMGTCYEKLGKQQAQQAHAAFQRIVADYPDQTKEVALAKQKLLSMQTGGITIREVRQDFTKGAPSSDGQIVCFVDWAKGGNVAIVDLKTAREKLLTNNGQVPKAYALSCDLSPDGTKIAYDWFHQEKQYCELRILDLKKGDSRTLLGKDAGFYHEGVYWSHDQRHIATAILEEKQWKIGWVSTEDGTTRVLKTVGASMPVLFPSPDDGYVAYSYTSTKDPSNFDIFMVSTDGSGKTIPLVEHPANERVLGWIPGKDELLFLSNRSGSYDVWTLPVKNGQPAGDPERIYPNLGDVDPGGFTKDGSYVFERLSMWDESFVSGYDPETGKLVGSLTQPISGHSLDWSPDGRRLAYVHTKNRPKGPGYYRGFLHIRDLQSGEDREVPCDFPVLAVRWSPDDGSLLMRGSPLNDNRKTRLYLVNTQTGKTRFVADRADLRIPIGEWAADGKGIYFVGKGVIVHHDLETGREKNLLTDPRLVGPLSLSPDGDLLAASVDDREKSSGLITINVRNGEVDNVVSLDRTFSRSTGNVIGGFDWSADGKYLLYLDRKEKGGTTLCRVPRQGGTPEKLWHTDKTVGDLRIHPDGKQLTFSQIRSDQSFGVMEGLLPKP